VASDYKILLTKTAKKDVDSLSPKLREKLYTILTGKIAKNPYGGKKLIGDLAGSYSVRLTLKDRVIYSIDSKKKIIYIERAKTHYGR